MNPVLEESIKNLELCKNEISKRIIGQDSLIEGMLVAIIAGGHVLLEGVPGLAKTLAAKTLSQVTGLSFKRVQFTPDLLPADLTGTMIYEQNTGHFSVRKGPVFANFVLADEINRAPAKVQSALLEAMAESQVTIGDVSYALPKPFFVLATQNPVEQEGTYPLPEAELDRFLLKLKVSYPTPQEEVEIVLKESGFESVQVSPVLTEVQLTSFRDSLQYISCDKKIANYIVSIVSATRPAKDENLSRRNRDDILRYITWGASPRASIALYKVAKAHALLQKRDYVLPEDVKAVAPDVLRHRLVLSYEAGSDELTSDDIISRLLSLIPLP